MANKTIQFIRNSSIPSTKQEAIELLNSESVKKIVKDGVMVTSRYSDDGVIKTIFGIYHVVDDNVTVTIYDSSHKHKTEDIDDLIERIKEEISKAQLGGSEIDLTDYAKKTDLDEKADSDHKHNITGVNGLKDSLDNKADKNHKHKASDIDGLEENIDNKISELVGQAPETLNTLEELSNALGKDPNFATTISNKIGNKADKSHTHDASHITSGTLDIARIPTGTSYNSVALGNHTHTVYDISGLNLSNYVEKSSLEDYAKSSDLSQYLTSSDIVDFITESDLTDYAKKTDLDEKSDLYHTHSISNISGLQGELNDKAAIRHKHDISDINELQNKLNGKASLSDVKSEVSKLVGQAPETLNTLEELSNALGKDPNFATTIANQIGEKSDMGHKHNASDITHGTLDIARIPTGTSPITVAIGNHTHKAIFIEGLNDLLKEKADVSHTHVIDWNANGYGTYIKNKPTSLKNPHSLIINGRTYDGSKEVNISTEIKTNFIKNSEGESINSTQNIGTNLEVGSASSPRTVTATSFYEHSDINLKSNISDVDKTSINAIVNNLHPVTFSYRSDENSKKHIGFIAQEVEKILPEVVLVNEESGLKSVDYSKFGVIAIAAIQSLKEEIEELKKEIKALKKIS